MEKEFVPYEQALALKELGFDAYCLGLYSYASRNTIDMQHVIHTCKASSKLKWMRVPTPTFSQAFRWFIEKHGIFSSIWCFETEQKFFIEFGFGIHKFEVVNKEEAELECLKKLIEIVKQKK